MNDILCSRKISVELDVNKISISHFSTCAKLMKHEFNKNVKLKLESNFMSFFNKCEILIHSKFPTI